MKPIHVLYCLSHLLAFCAGAGAVCYCRAQPAEADAGDRPRVLAPIPWAKVRPSYEERLFICDSRPDIDKRLISVSACEYLMFRATVDGAAISLLNASDHVYNRPPDYEGTFKQFKQRHKLWHINYVRQLGLGLADDKELVVVDMFWLARDVPGFGEKGDHIWVLTTMRNFGWYYRHLFFVNSRTTEFFSLFPPEKGEFKVGPDMTVKRVLVTPPAEKPD
jgi:hypothetical protein